MEPSSTIVRPVSAQDEIVWRRLWDGDLGFYEVALDAETTSHTWCRLLNPGNPMSGVVAQSDGVVVGFALYLLHEGSWSRSLTCHLEDLFVAPEARMLGIGRRLVEHLVKLGRERHWASIYWHTQDANIAARSLYDSIASTSGFVRYRLRLN